MNAKKKRTERIRKLEEKISSTERQLIHCTSDEEANSILQKINAYHTELQALLRKEQTDGKSNLHVSR